MKNKLMAAAAACLLALQPALPRAQNDENEAKRVRDGATVFGEIMSAEDKAIPNAIVGKAAGPVGRDAQAATDIQLRAQILSYSRARGLFAGITINGSTIRQDLDANQRFYGKRLTTKQIVFDGQAGSPDPVGIWRAALDRYAK